MNLIINGECREFSGLRTLPEVIEALGLAPQTLLVEHNERALHRSEWADCPLAEGDRLEILRIAAGG
jgi:thiamine biosynthesis protein ThiS